MRMFVFSTLKNQPHVQDYNRKHVCVLSTGPRGQCFTWPFTTAATSKKLCSVSYLLLTSSGSWAVSFEQQLRWLLRVPWLSNSYWRIDPSQTGFQTSNVLLISVTIIVSITVRGNFICPVGKLGCYSNKPYKQTVFSNSSPFSHLTRLPNPLNPHFYLLIHQVNFPI